MQPVIQPGAAGTREENPGCVHKGNDSALSNPTPDPASFPWPHVAKIPIVSMRG